MYYQWHPLYGQEVIVRKSKAGKRGVFCCQIDNDDKRDNREIPIWMFDQFYCEQMVCSSEPYVFWTTLLDLRQLLDASMHTVTDEMVEDRSPQLTGETDEATIQTKDSDTAERLVRRPNGTATVVGLSHRSAKDGDRVDCPDVEAATGSRRGRHNSGAGV